MWKGECGRGKCRKGSVEGEVWNWGVWKGVWKREVWKGEMWKGECERGSVQGEVWKGNVWKGNCGPTTGNNDTTVN